MGKPMGRTVRPAKTRRDGQTDVTLPKDGKPGNTKRDQAWIEAHGAELQEAPEGVELPFGVKYRWADHDAAEIGGAATDEFLLEDVEGQSERRCSGRSAIRDGEGRRIIDQAGILLTRPCALAPMKGSVVCHAHGGLTPGGKKAAQQRLDAASHAVVGRLIAIALNPGTLDDTAIRAINSILDRAGIRAGVDVSVETPEWQSMLKELFEKAGAGG